MKNFSLTRGVTTTLLLAAAALPLCAQDYTEIVELDKLEVSADKESNFSLPLDAAPASASRLGLTNRDLPVSVSVVTQEVMQLRGLRTAVEAVESAVGMTGGTQYGSIPTYTTRGFGSNSVSILRDGIRQNTASQSSRTVDSFLMDRVEVLKGPAGLMFGEGAIGGAVNYISKAPSAIAKGEAFFSAGAWDSYRVGLGWGGPLPIGRDNTVTARVDYSHNETAGYVDRNVQRYDAVAGAVGWQASEKLKLTFNTTYLEDWNESYYGNPVVYDAVIDTTVAGAQPEVRSFNSNTDAMINARVDESTRQTNYNILDNYAETENSLTRLRAELTLTPGIEVRNETYIATQLLKWRNLETNVWNPITQLVDRRSFLHIYRDDVLTGNRLDFTHRGTIAGRPNRFLIGGFFERNDQARGGAPADYATIASSVTLQNPAETYGPGDPNRFQKTSRIVVQTGALYLENALDLTPALKLIVGLRRDEINLQRDTLVTPTTIFATYEKRYDPWTGRGGLVWSVTKDLNLYAGYSRAAEPTTQLVSFNASSNDFALQTGRQFEIGAKGTVADGKVDFTLALFDIEKNNILSSTLDPDTGLRISQQIGAQNSRGVEFALAVSPDPTWRVELNAAWTDAWYGSYAQNLGTGIIDRTGCTPANIPEWVAGLFAHKRLPGGFAVNAGLRYVSDRFGNLNNSVVAEGYATLDAGVSYTFGRTSITLRGRNLTDEVYEPVAGTTMRRLADPRSAELSIRTTF